MRWGVNIEPNSDAVAYWSIILGTFMASFDLKAFPFDTQRLHVQMEIPGWAGGNVVLKPSSAGTRMFNTNPGGQGGGDNSSVRVRGLQLRCLGASSLLAASRPVPIGAWLTDAHRGRTGGLWHSAGCLVSDASAALIVLLFVTLTTPDTAVSYACRRRRLERLARGGRPHGPL